jgi:tetratricopeptide (TPR) repeat protein
VQELPRTEYSPGLEAILARSLARRPQDRYQSLDDMHADLGELVRTVAPRVMAREAPGRNTRAERGADDEALRRKVQDMGDTRAEVEQARAEGQLQKALSLSRRLAEMNPGDAEAARLTAEIEAAIQDREVEQLCGMALNYAADGDMDLALKIAGKIERLAPQNARYRQLQSYLEEERARRNAEAWTNTAKEYLVQGNLEEAVAAAEEALTAMPGLAVARELRDRAKAILATRQKAEREATRAQASEDVPPTVALPAVRAVPAAAPPAPAAARPPAPTPPTPPAVSTPVPVAPPPQAAPRPVPAPASGTPLLPGRPRPYRRQCPAPRRRFGRP